MRALERIHRRQRQVGRVLPTWRGTCPRDRCVGLRLLGPRDRARRTDQRAMRRVRAGLPAAIPVQEAPARAAKMMCETIAAARGITDPQLDV